MTIRRLAVLALLPGAVAVRAADLPMPSLPMLAAAPGSAAPGTPPWTGLYAGTSVFALAGSHHTSAVGGSVAFGYDHAFDNRFVIGIEGNTGLARGSFGGSRFNGVDFAGTNVKLGYDMGRVLPYAFVGVGLAKPTFQSHTGFTGGGDALNDLFAGRSGLRTTTTVGAGVDYAITNHLTVGFSVSATQSRGEPGFGENGPVDRSLP